MTRRTAVGLAAANTILAALGSLAVAPGSTDSFAYSVSGDSGIVVAAVYFVLGPVWGLTTLAFDAAALLAGLVATGSAIGADMAVGFLTAFRSLSRYTESQLAEYSKRIRLRARVEAMSRVDSAALEDARRVAGPVLAQVASGHALHAALRTAALANALGDELLAPGFLTAALAERVRAARTAGARIIINFARQGDMALAETARELMAATLADLDAGDDLTLQVHPAAEGYPALLLLRVRSVRSGHVNLRHSADDRGALISDLGDHELLIRLQRQPERTAVPAA
jgi:hypothetical protein